MTNATFQTAGDVFDGWRDDVLTGSPPVLYPIGTGDLARIEIGPGLRGQLLSKRQTSGGSVASRRRLLQTLGMSKKTTR